jgi:hypothetical protein
MSWQPNDLVTDADLVDYEADVLTNFGKVEWAARRRKALEDWLWPQLRAARFVPERFRTRFQPDKVWRYVSAVYADVTDATKDTTSDDVPLATIFALSTNYLYVGSAQAFRGLSVRVLDSVNAVAATLTVEYWGDEWGVLGVTDGTAKSAGKPFSGGGAITWDLPGDWVVRPVNSSAPLYWVRLKLSAAPTAGTAASQIGCIRRSSLCAPVTFRTLMHIFREAPTAQDGPWREKAEWYEQEANASLERALLILGGEFDTVTPDDVVDETEATQTTAEVTGGAWTMERA